MDLYSVLLARMSGSGGGGAVDSVNGKIGEVILTGNDVDLSDNDQTSITERITQINSELPAWQRDELWHRSARSASYFIEVRNAGSPTTIGTITDLDAADAVKVSNINALYTIGYLGSLISWDKTAIKSALNANLIPCFEALRDNNLIYLTDAYDYAIYLSVRANDGQYFIESTKQKNSNELHFYITKPNRDALMVYYDISSDEYIYWNIISKDLTYDGISLSDSARLNARTNINAQEVISDLDAIRSGAAAGATALQPPTRITATLNESDSVTLADNTEYILDGADCYSVDFEYPTGNFECYIRLTTKSNGTTITFPTGTQYIGSVPTIGNSETWEFSIKDGIVVAGKVVSV